MSAPSPYVLPARLWLATVFVLITGAHFLFYLFSMNPLNYYAISQGMTFGLILWTSVLWVAMWIRRGWARYLMITFLALGIVAYGLVMLKLSSESVNPLPWLIHRVVGGMILYALALIPLGTARSLHRYLQPRTAGGR